MAVNGGLTRWYELAGIAAIIAAGAAWTIGAVNTSGTSALSAINTQANIVAKAEADLDRRITIIETEQAEQGHALDRLTTQTEQLRGTAGDLTTAVQRLNDLMPTERRR